MTVNFIYDIDKGQIYSYKVAWIVLLLLKIIDGKQNHSLVFFVCITAPSMPIWMVKMKYLYESYKCEKSKKIIIMRIGFIQSLDKKRVI